MIDLHCHILPGLDDGPDSLEEALQMCLICYRDGVRTVVATPHVIKGVYSNNRSIILKKISQLKDALRQFFLSTNSESDNPQLQLRIIPGADVYFSEDLLRKIEDGHLLTIGDEGKFVLIEFPFQGIPYRAEDLLFQLLGRGITPIITHPERNLEISQRPKRYYEMVRMGCLGELTAMSLTGEFGSEVKKVAEKFLRHKLVHFIASDAHSINGRPPILSKALKIAEKLIGEDEARKMVKENPLAVLNGYLPNIPAPIPL